MISTALVLTFCVPAFAQWGHPLKGSWSGEWWIKKGEDHRILLDFDWDGKTLKGMLNPGSDDVPVQNLTLQPPPINDVSKAMDPWLLHFEAEVKDASGKIVRYVVDGKMQNLGSYNRFITGTWAVGNQKGEFKIVRN
jgi:hypothetical protein